MSSWNQNASFDDNFDDFLNLSEYLEDYLNEVAFTDTTELIDTASLSQFADEIRYHVDGSYHPLIGRENSNPLAELEDFEAEIVQSLPNRSPAQIVMGTRTISDTNWHNLGVKLLRQIAGNLEEGVPIQSETCILEAAAAAVRRERLELFGARGRLSALQEFRGVEMNSTDALDGPTPDGIRLNGKEYKLPNRTRKIAAVIWSHPKKSVSFLDASDDHAQEMTKNMAKKRQSEFNRATAESGWEMSLVGEYFTFRRLPR